MDARLHIHHKVSEAKRTQEKERLEAEFDTLIGTIRQRNRNILREKLHFRGHRAADSGEQPGLHEEFHAFFRMEYAIKALSLGIRREDVQEIFLLSPDVMQRLERA